MSSIRRHSRLLLVAVCCVAVGAGISAIATAGATTSATKSSAHSGAQHMKRRAGGLRRLAHAVQGSAVVRTAGGFATVTFERGKVDSSAGSSSRSPRARPRPPTRR